MNADWAVANNDQKHAAVVGALRSWSDGDLCIFASEVGKIQAQTLTCEQDQLVATVACVLNALCDISLAWLWEEATRRLSESEPE